MNYKITPSAEQDLGEILDFISAESPRAAHRLEERLFDAFRQLGIVPGMGRRREDLTDLPLRFFGVQGYLIAYYSEASPIEIIRVISGVRDLPKIFA